MGMAGTVVNVHILNDATSETVLGEHTLHDLVKQRVDAGFEVLVVRFLDEHFGSCLALSAGIAGVAEIDAICQLISGETYLVGIDDDYVVATIHEGRIARLVLTAEQFGNFCAQTSENLVGGIHHNPFFFDALSVGSDCSVT